MAPIFINLKLFAFDSLPPDQKALYDKTLAQYHLLTNVHSGSGPDQLRDNTDIAPCSSCAAPHALLTQVIAALKKIPGASDIAPIGELELQYAVAKIDIGDGEHCKMIRETYDDTLHARRLDGQLTEVAEGVFEKYSAIAELTYNAPGLKASVYYYRDKANHIVQVLVDNNGKASFRYYEFTPHIPEKKTINLPEVFEKYSPPKEPVKSVLFVDQSEIKAPPEVAVSNSYYNGSLDLTVVKERHGLLKEIPSNAILGEGTAHTELGETKIHANETTSVAHGNQVKIDISHGSDVLVNYSVATSIAGNFTASTIAIPVNINIGSAVTVAGSISDTRTSGARSKNMVMNFLEPEVPDEKSASNIVSVNVTQIEGRPIIYHLDKTVTAGDKIYTASAGKDFNGGFVGVTYSPVKNINGESVQVKFVNEGGHVAGYATYSRATDILK